MIINMNQRNVIDTVQLMRLVKTVETLVMLGRPKNKAILDVANANGLTPADVMAVNKLIKE